MAYFLRNCDIKTAELFIPGSVFKMKEHRVPSITLPELHVRSVLSVLVVIGHYSLLGYPIRLSNHVACVDYNAAKDEQPIVAYEWFSGESVTLDNQAFYFVDKQPLHSFHILGMELVFQHYIEQLQNTYTLTDPLIDIVNSFQWKEWDPIGVNSLIACRDEYQAYGSGNNGRYYMDVECDEAIQVEQVDLIYDSDLIIELHLKISATKLGEETFRHTIKKGEIKDKVLLWKD